MKSKMVLDRIPCQFCEGPFWGNGKMGAVPVVFDSGVTNYALALRFMEGGKGTDFLHRTKRPL